MVSTGKSTASPRSRSVTQSKTSGNFVGITPCDKSLASSVSGKVTSQECLSSMRDKFKGQISYLDINPCTCFGSYGHPLKIR